MTSQLSSSASGTYVPPRFNAFNVASGSQRRRARRQRENLPRQPSQHCRVQHLGGSNFQVVARKAAVIDRLLANNGVSADGHVVPFEVLAPQVVNVTVPFHLLFLYDELRQALSPHENILHAEKSPFHDHARLYTGTRVVKMEISYRNSVLNFLRVNGHCVTCE